MISLQMVNNETGAVQEVQELGDFIRRKKKKVFFHTDAVQAFGKMPIDIDKLGVDLLTFSAHKFYGPKGLGGLWVSDECILDTKNDFPYLGTVPAELVIRFAEGIKNCNTQYVADNLAMKEDIFFNELLRHMPYDSISTGQRMVGIRAMIFKGVDAFDLQQSLADKKVYVSLGSACTSGKVGPSHVLSAMEIEPSRIASTIRVSFGHMITQEQCKEAAIIVAETVKELRDGCEPSEDRGSE